MGTGDQVAGTSAQNFIELTSSVLLSTAVNRHARISRSSANLFAKSSHCPIEFTNNDQLSWDHIFGSSSPTAETRSVLAVIPSCIACPLLPPGQSGSWNSPHTTVETDRRG